jgi:hypothetical protein
MILEVARVEADIASLWHRSSLFCLFIRCSWFLISVCSVLTSNELFFIQFFCLADEASADSPLEYNVVLEIRLL